MKTPDEHIGWCKQRACRYLDIGDLEGAVASMVGDLEDHPATAASPYLAVLGMMYATNGDAAGVRRWVEGFR
jgi:hypothetical protein